MTDNFYFPDRYKTIEDEKVGFERGLHDAACNGILTDAKYLLDRGVDIDCLEDGITSLCRATVYYSWLLLN